MTNAKPQKESIKQNIKSNLKRSLVVNGYDDFEPEVYPTTDQKFGDYYSATALKVSQVQKKQSLQETAKNIEANLPKNSPIFSAHLAPNGFINFKIKKDFLQSIVQKIIESDMSFGAGEVGKGRKARVEFISANPTGPLHIGNARGGPLGDTIANVLEFSGHQVLREYLNNDQGNQILELGKTLATKAGLLDLEKIDLTYSGEYTTNLAQKIKKHLNAEKLKSENQIFEKAGRLGADLLLKDILKDASDTGIKFDLVVNESDLQSKIPQALDKLKSVLKEYDGATWFAPRNEFLKDKDAVVVKSDGTYTYFGSDIVYHQEKFGSGYDLVVDIFGSNTSGHVPKLKALAQALGFDDDRFRIILYQFVRVKRGENVIRMSKRAGNFITAREVLDEVGKDAFRFNLLMYDPSTHMDFDLEKAKRASVDNPVYYVQYAHARCNSLLKKAQQNGISLENLSKQDTSLLIKNDELALIRKMIRFPDLIDDLSHNFAVHLLPAFSIELADKFHKYYEQERIIGKEAELSMARLALVKAVKIVLRNSLQLMGISAPEQMTNLEKTDVSKTT